MRQNARRHYHWNVGLRITVVFAYLCIVPIVLCAIRTVYVWWYGPSSGYVKLKHHSEPFEGEDMRRLERRIEQLEAEASLARYRAPTETIARWTAISGNETLSEKDL